MADNISIRGGDKEGMPTLRDREPAFVQDEKALYIGTPDGNLKLCSAETEGKVNSLEEAIKAHSEEISGIGDDIKRIDEELGNIDATIAGISEAMKSINGEIASLSEEKLSASAAASVSTVAADAEAADIAAKLNELISALKISGIMST